MAPGLELLLEHERGAGVHGRDQREAEAAHPEQRHRRVEHVVGDEVAHLPEVVGVAHGGAVGVDGALRVGGAPDEYTTTIGSAGVTSRLALAAAARR